MHEAEGLELAEERGPDGAEEGGEAHGEARRAQQDGGVALEERAARARREHGEEVGERDLEVDHALQRAVVDLLVQLVQRALQAEVQQQERGDHGDDAEQRGDDEHLGQVPGAGLGARVHEVVGDGDDGAVVQGRDEYDDDDGQLEPSRARGARATVQRLREGLRAAPFLRG